MRLSDDPRLMLDIEMIADTIRSLFPEYEGVLYLSDKKEVLCLLKLGEQATVAEVYNPISSALPDHSCKLNVCRVTPEGLSRIELQLDLNAAKKRKSVQNYPGAEQRKLRKENVIMIADDDMYMRSLVKQALKFIGKVVEVGDGKDVQDVYKEEIPDIVFLDIHLPNKEGIHILQDIMEMDHEAYIVMLSADSNETKVSLSAELGTKGFIVKPFTKDQLLGYVKKCPTIIS